MTKVEKREIDDSGDSGGILLKSNTEAPGEEVVRTALKPLLSPLATLLYCFISPTYALICQRLPAVSPLCAQDTSLITVPTIVEPVTKGSVKGQMASSGWPGQTMGTLSQVDKGFYESNMVTSDTQEFYSGQYDGQFGGQYDQGGGYLVSSAANIDNQYMAQNAGFLHNWQTNGRYLQQVKCFTVVAVVARCDCRWESKGTVSWCRTSPAVPEV